MKTPKREHSCIWCGGPLDVHLDPNGKNDDSSMCRNCRRHTISHCGHTWEPYKERARWKRKNREARLRHKIAVLQELVTELDHDCKERYEAVEELLQRDKDNCHEIAALKSANSELAIWLKQLCEKKAPELLTKQPINRLVEKYAHERHRVPYSTYGQDVEGS